MEMRLVDAWVHPVNRRKNYAKQYERKHSSSKKESRAARQIPLKFFRLLNMKSIFVSLSFRDFFSLFRRREKWWNTIIFSLPCYTETFDCDCKIISPLFTIVVARSFGFRSATTTDSSLYLTFISSNSIYEQTCFYCLWNDCNYNFVALFFLCFFGSFSIHALFVRSACRKSFASSDCVAIFRISLSVAVSFREKSELSWAPGWCAQVGYIY